MGDQNIVLGANAGENGQGIFSVAIGNNAGRTNQAAFSVAVGPLSGAISQGAFSVAIGGQAGNDQQGSTSTAIGFYAGNSIQGNNAVAIGPSAGQVGQGVNSIAIGNVAGVNNQAANSIILNATGNTLDSSVPDPAFYVAPVRADITQAKVLGYDTTTMEVTYFNTPGGGGGSLPVGTNYGDYLYWDGSTYAVGDANVALGGNAGSNSQGQYSVAVGNNAGANGQVQNSVAIGVNAAMNSGGFIGGDWAQYKLPNPIVLKYYQLAAYVTYSDPDYDAENPYEWYLLASNDGLRWTEIDYQSGQDYTKWADLNVDPVPQYYNTYAVQNTKAYQYYRLVITSRDTSVNTANYYGMCLYAFNLIEDGAILSGVPGHEFVDSGNVYPNVLLTSADDQGYVTTESYPENNALYNLSAQYQSQTLGSLQNVNICTNEVYNPVLYNPYNFNVSITPVSTYVSASDIGNSISIGNSAGQNSQTKQSIALGNNAGQISASGFASGEWIQYKLPAPIVLKYYQLACDYVNYDVATNYYDTENPYEWYLLASNDNVSWDKIDFQTGQDYTKWTFAPGAVPSKYNTYTIKNNTTAYQYYRLVCTKSDPAQNQGNYIDIGAFNLIEGGTLTSEDGHGFLDPTSGGTVYPTLQLFSPNESGYEISQSTGFNGFASGNDPIATGAYLLSINYASQTEGSLFSADVFATNLYQGTLGVYKPEIKGFGYMISSYGTETLVGNSVAIGTNAGLDSQKEYAIAIGANAGTFNQPANTIILNATGADLNNDTTDPALYIAPIRGLSQSNFLGYNTVTKEVTYFVGSSLPSGTNYGDYLYWDGSTYAVGDANVVLGGNAGATNQGSGSVAIGYSAGSNNQSIALPQSFTGEWFEYLADSPITPTYFQLSFMDLVGTKYFADSFTIVASNDGSTWTRIGQQDNVQLSSIVSSGFGYNTYAVNATIPYQYFRVIFTHKPPSIYPIWLAAFNLIVGGTIDTDGLSVGGTAYPGETVPGGLWTKSSGFDGTTDDLAGSPQSLPTKESGAIQSQTNIYSSQTGDYVGTETTSVYINLGNSIAIGYQAAQNTQGYQSIAIGVSAGQDVQNINAIAIGVSAGASNQGTNAIAIGQFAGQTNQAANSIAIGLSAGASNQGTNAIAIGQFAGQTDQAANSIVINATGISVTGAGNIASALYMSPVRGDVTQSKFLGYDTNTSEVTYFNFPIQNGINYGDYLYWNGSTYAVADTNIVLGGNAGSSNQGSGSIAVGYQAGTNNQSVNYQQTIAGEWFQYVATSPITPTHFQLSFQNQSFYSDAFTIVASNDGTSWFQIGQQTNIQPSSIIPFSGGYNVYPVNATIPYQYFRVIFTHCYNGVSNIYLYAFNLIVGGTFDVNGFSIGGTAYPGSEVLGSQWSNSAGAWQSPSFYLAGTQQSAPLKDNNNSFYLNSEYSGSGQYVGPNTTTATVNLGNSIAIGYQAAQNTQGCQAIAIGTSAGQDVQNINAIAIGVLAGASNQGTNAIAIGQYAGQTDQAANSIILNATGNAFDSAVSGLFVKPLRDASAALTGSLLLYNTSSGEFAYSTTDLSASNKTFVIQHPDEVDKYLVHACLEGPEAGVYYRGEGVIANGGKKVVITLPSYVKNLATDLTVHLTPVLNDSNESNDDIDIPTICSTRVRGNSFTVYANKPCSFHWMVFGKRGEVKTEVGKSDAIMRGDGPYRWLDNQ